MFFTIYLNKKFLGMFGYIRESLELRTKEKEENKECLLLVIFHLVTVRKNYSIAIGLLQRSKCFREVTLKIWYSS